jgi:hypothetical protein
VDNRQTPYVVAAGPAVVLCFVLAVDDVAPSFARGHAEQRCSGTCPQQARSSSAPYPLEGPVHGLCPGPGSGKRRARQLRRNTALLHLVIPRHAEVATTYFVQIARTRSSNATVSRWPTGTSTASS